MVMWVSIFDILRSPVTKEEREAKSNIVKDKAKQFVDEWVKWAGKDSIKYYHHCLAHHVHELILGSPIELWKASGQEIEQLNQDMNVILRLGECYKPAKCFREIFLVLPQNGHQQAQRTTNSGKTR